jgi:hypothetical protein
MPQPNISSMGIVHHMFCRTCWMHTDTRFRSGHVGHDLRWSTYHAAGRVEDAAKVKEEELVFVEVPLEDVEF